MKKNPSSLEQGTVIPFFKANISFKCLKKSLEENGNWADSFYDIFKLYVIASEANTMSKIIINAFIAWGISAEMLMAVQVMIQYWWNGENSHIHKHVRFYWHSVCSLRHHRVSVLLHWMLLLTSYQAHGSFKYDMRAMGLLRFCQHMLLSLQIQ